MRHSRRHSIEYAVLLAGALVLATVASFTPLGGQIDKDAYDWFFRIYSPPDWATQSIVLAIDDETFHTSGGVSGIRGALAEGLDLIAPAAPRAVAIDVNLVEEEEEPADSNRLEAAIRRTPNVVLASYLEPGGDTWEDPLPRFSGGAAGKGHVHTELDPVCREIVLRKAAGHDGRWALAFEAYLAGAGAQALESPRDVEVGSLVIPAPAPDRVLRIRYRPPDRPIPRISLARLRADRGLAKQFSGKTVFFGVTAQTAGDRQQTPYSPLPMPGVEIHANVFETIANRLFLVDPPAGATLAFCLMLVVLGGAEFAFLSGWQAYTAGAVTLVSAMVAPYICFTHGTVLAFTQPVFSAVFSLAAAASYQTFVVRKRMLTAEADKSRYQQAMHFVTHEMRTPLTAIQGSSELIGRYALTEEKRKQMAQLINSESKRLGRMIEIFLSVERLSAGEMELKEERFSGMDLMAACVERVRPLAERKEIAIHIDPGPDAPLVGDRELMDYAFYNLLTNAVKYSPSSTEVRVFAARDGERVRISVKDQGIGMDTKEVRKIFQKFYRTRKAEESGEVGTGIGLSIVEQIVTQHGGSVEVTSSPGRGSCFTLVLPTQKISSMVESK
jgi:signal transduction histidine kinase